MRPLCAKVFCMLRRIFSMPVQIARILQDYERNALFRMRPRAGAAVVQVIGNWKKRELWRAFALFILPVRVSFCAA